MGFFSWLSDQAKQAEYGGDYKNVIELKSIQNQQAYDRAQQELENARKVAEYTELLKRAQTRNYESQAESRDIRTGLEVDKAPDVRAQILARIESLKSGAEKNRVYSETIAPSIVNRNNASANASNARAAGGGKADPYAATKEAIRQARLVGLQRQNQAGGAVPRERAPSYYQDLARQIVGQIHGQYADLTDPAVLSEIQQYAQTLQQTDHEFDQRRLAGEDTTAIPTPQVPVKPRVAASTTSGFGQTFRDWLTGHSGQGQPAPAPSAPSAAAPTSIDPNQIPAQVQAAGGTIRYKGKTYAWNALTPQQKAAVWAYIRSQGGN